MTSWHAEECKGVLEKVPTKTTPSGASASKKKKEPQTTADAEAPDEPKPKKPKAHWTRYDQTVCPLSFNPMIIQIKLEDIQTYQIL